MKNMPDIRSALDESLSSVRFDAQDMHSVLRRVHAQERPAQRRRMPRWGLALGAAALAIVPLLAFSIGRAPLRDIATVAAPGLATTQPLRGVHEDVILASPQPASPISEEQAAAIAQRCFENYCDIGVFTAAEYAVRVQSVDGETPMYTATMTCIYGNGCTFTVHIDARSGEVLSFSDPIAATQPDASAAGSEAARSWLMQYGEDRSAWPPDIRAEFARRYEGSREIDAP